MRAFASVAGDVLLLSLFVVLYFGHEGADDRTFLAIFGFVMLYLNGVLTGVALGKWARS